MEKFILSTDSTCDMPMSYYEENEIVLSPLTFIMEGKEYGGEGLPQMDDKEFYSKLKNGSMPKTSQITLDGALQKLEPFAKENKPLLHIAFSSGLSGTYNSFLLASEELKEKYPDWNVIVIDSLCASMGEGLYLDYAVTLRNEGKSMEETAEILERDKQKLCHFFTVNNLFHLQRGGRVSKVSAVFGSMLGIKPVLHVNNEGKLIPIAKVRGRKASLDYLVNAAMKKLDKEKAKKFFVSHGDCYDDAKYVADRMTKEFGIQENMIHMIGPVIGSHSGDGTVALFFLGSGRDPV